MDVLAILTAKGIIGGSAPKGKRNPDRGEIFQTLDTPQGAHVMCAIHNLTDRELIVVGGRRSAEAKVKELQDAGKELRKFLLDGEKTWEGKQEYSHFKVVSTNERSSYGVRMLDIDEPTWTKITILPAAVGIWDIRLLNPNGLRSRV